jgi:hypothetical protein
MKLLSGLRLSVHHDAYKKEPGYTVTLYYIHAISYIPHKNLMPLLCLSYIYSFLFWCETPLACFAQKNFTIKKHFKKWFKTTQTS